MKDEVKMKQRSVNEPAEYYRRVVELDESKIAYKDIYNNLREVIPEKKIILDTLSELIVYQDVDYRVLWANKAAGESVNLAADELIGRYCYDIWHQRNEPCIDCPVNKALKTGKAEEGEINFSDGSSWLIRGNPLRDTRDNILSVLVVMMDITERKRAENLLQESEEMYRTVFENSGTAMGIVEEDATISLGNTEIERLTGYTKAEVEGKKSWMEFVAGNNLEKLKEYHSLRRIEPNAAPENYEFQLIDKQGDIKDIYMTIAMIPGTKKSVASFLDITERKRAEKALRESEERFRTYINTSPYAITATNLNGKIVMANWQTVKMHGYESIDDLIGMSAYDLIAPQDRERATNNAEKTLEGGILRNIEYTFLRKDGSEFPAELSTSVILDEEGKPKALIAVTCDITERKQVEGQLKYLCLHDPLTGLYNRTYFEEEMRRHQGRRNYPAGIIVCDMDGLKLVNDTLGHDAGDAVLLAAACIIRDSFRTGDVVARIGGDEFAVLLPYSDRSIVESSIQRIRDAVARYNTAKPGIPLSISIGFAIRKDASVSMTNLFKEADNNMYREKLHSGQSARSAIVRTLMKSLEARDFITEGHADRMQDLVMGLALTIGLADHKIADLRLFARFHDIGKVGIPDRILFKPGPLTPHEVTEMRRHCEIGYRITMSAPDLVPIANWILKHHEWWNGEGYPLGLRGEEIPLECRILAIADAYEAITSNRPYRKAMTHEKAIDELRKYSGIQFDPNLVFKFIQLFKNKNR